MSNDELLIVSCRPLNPADLTGVYRTVWDLDVLHGREPKICEGSVVGVCQNCRMKVPIGPGQQQRIATWVAAGIAHQVLCLGCTTELTLGIHADIVAVDVQNVGISPDV